MKFEEKVYYKIFSRVGLNYVSWSWLQPSPFYLHYSLNKITRSVPGSIGILVFDTLRSVYKFNPMEHRALKCLVKGPVIKVDHVINFESGDTITTILKWIKDENVTSDQEDQAWTRAYYLSRYKKYANTSKYLKRTQRIKDLQKSFNTMLAPGGTFSVNAVKPIEEVKI